MKEWESYLESDEKVHYKNKWNKLSKRFWKDILDNFENWRTYLKKQYEFRKWDKDLFKLSYKSFVRNPLLEKNNLSYIKFETSKSLMQLYSKYIGFMRKYEENEEKIANEIQAEIEQEKMEKIFNNNQSKPFLILRLSFHQHHQYYFQVPMRAILRLTYGLFRFLCTDSFLLLHFGLKYAPGHLPRQDTKLRFYLRYMDISYSDTS